MSANGAADTDEAAGGAAFPTLTRRFSFQRTTPAPQPGGLAVLLFSLSSSILNVATLMDRMVGRAGGGTWSDGLRATEQRLDDGVYGFGHKRNGRARADSDPTLFSSSETTLSSTGTSGERGGEEWEGGRGKERRG